MAPLAPLLPWAGREPDPTSLAKAAILAGTTGNGCGTADGNSGSAFGSGILIQGNQSVTLGAAGKLTTLKDSIADQTDSGGTGANADIGSVRIAGGTVSLNGANPYVGAITVDASAILYVGDTGRQSFGCLGTGGQWHPPFLQHRPAGAHQ